jgi:hypothetical protein
VCATPHGIVELVVWGNKRNVDGNNSQVVKRPKIQEPGDILTPLVYPVKKGEREINQ